MSCHDPSTIWHFNRGSVLSEIEAYIFNSYFSYGSSKKSPSSIYKHYFLYKLETAKLYRIYILCKIVYLRDRSKDFNAVMSLSLFISMKCTDISPLEQNPPYFGKCCQPCCFENITLSYITLIMSYIWQYIPKSHVTFSLHLWQVNLFNSFSLDLPTCHIFGHTAKIYIFMHINFYV